MPGRPQYRVLYLYSQGRRRERAVFILERNVRPISPRFATLRPIGRSSQAGRTFTAVLHPRRYRCARSYSNFAKLSTSFSYISPGSRNGSSTDAPVVVRFRVPLRVHPLWRCVPPVRAYPLLSASPGSRATICGPGWRGSAPRTARCPERGATEFRKDVARVSSPAAFSHGWCGVTRATTFVYQTDRLSVLFLDSVWVVYRTSDS